MNYSQFGIAAQMAGWSGVDWQMRDPNACAGIYSASHSIGTWAGPQILIGGAGGTAGRGATAGASAIRGGAASSATARFIASGDGVVTDLIGSKNAISIGHYPAYVANAQATGARTFSIADDAWNAMSPAEQWLHNKRFLDDAIARGSQIQLATPLNQVRAGTFLEREIAYLLGKGYGPNSSGTLMIPGGS